MTQGIVEDQYNKKGEIIMYILKRAFMIGVVGISTLLSSIVVSDNVYSVEQPKPIVEKYNVTAGVVDILASNLAQNAEVAVEETVEEEKKEPDLNLVKFKSPKVFYISAKSGLNVRSVPSAKKKSTIVDALPYNHKVKVTGKVKGTKFYYIQTDSDIVYISSKYLSKKKLPELKKSSTQLQSISTNWSGARLTRSAGTITGPSGKETYYNLPMQGVVSIMRGIGNNDTYWVRSDGVKMLGNYVMVAADLSIRPRGSHVPTSLGMGVVCDTGTFIYSNRTQLDIAVAWS